MAKTFLSICIFTLLFTSILTSGCQTEANHNSLITPLRSYQFEGALIQGVLNPVNWPGFVVAAQWTGDTIQTIATIVYDTSAKQQIFSLFAIGITADSGGAFFLKCYDTLFLTIHAPANTFVPGRISFDSIALFDFEMTYYHLGRVYKSIKTKLGSTDISYLSDSVISGGFDYGKVVNKSDTVEFFGTGFQVHYKKL